MKKRKKMKNWKIKKFRESIQVKDAVLFDPKDKEMLVEALQMDTYEPPMTQVTTTVPTTYEPTV